MSGTITFPCSYSTINYSVACQASSKKDDAASGLTQYSNAQIVGNLKVGSFDVVSYNHNLWVAIGC